MCVSDDFKTISVTLKALLLIAYLCDRTAYTHTIDIIIRILSLCWFNIKGTQYSLDDKLYHMGQAWDLGRITAPTIIDVQVVEQLFQFLPHRTIIPRFVSGDT